MNPADFKEWSADDGGDPPARRATAVMGNAAISGGWRLLMVAA